MKLALGRRGAALDGDLDLAGEVLPTGAEAVAPTLEVDRDPRLRLRPKEALHVLIQLRAMLNAGVPLLAALRSLVEHASTPSQRRALEKIARAVESGHDLSYAFDCLPRCFEKYVVHLVSAGEQAGTLDDALDRCVELLENQIRLGGKIKGALAYPGFLIGLTFVMTTGILFFLVPRFEKLLLSKPELLPWPTKLVLGTSGLIRAHPELILLFYGGLALLVVLAMKNRHVRRLAFRVVSHVPGVGNLIHKAYLARSVNTLAMTLESGVPILTGLEHARQISELPKLQQAWEQASHVVRDGRPMHLALTDAELPPALVQMIIAGESTGSLDASLRKAGEFLDRETQAAMELLTGLLGPATVVLAGGLVGFIVVALMMPILQMAKFVG